MLRLGHRLLGWKEAEEVAADNKSVVCSICTEQRATAFCGSVAKHGMCSNCLHGYITGTLGDRTIFLECIVCPQLGCDARMARDDAASVLSAKEVAAISKRAEESDKLVAKAVHDAQSKRVIDRTTSRCPKCRVPIEKAMGCRHMRCTMCNTGFWFGCNCVYPGPCPHGDMYQPVSGAALEALNTTGVPTLEPRFDFDIMGDDGHFDVGLLREVIRRRRDLDPPTEDFRRDPPNRRSLVGLRRNMEMFLAEYIVHPAVRAGVTWLLQTLREDPGRVDDVAAQFARLENEHVALRRHRPPALAEGPPAPWRNHNSGNPESDLDLDSDSDVSLEMPARNAGRNALSGLGTASRIRVRDLQSNMETFVTSRRGLPAARTEVTRILHELAEHPDQVVDLETPFVRSENRSPAMYVPPSLAAGAAARSAPRARFTFTDPRERRVSDFPRVNAANGSSCGAAAALGATTAYPFTFGRLQEPGIGAAAPLGSTDAARRAASDRPPGFTGTADTHDLRRPFGDRHFQEAADESARASQARLASSVQVLRTVASILQSSTSPRAPIQPSTPLFQFSPFDFSSVLSSRVPLARAPPHTRNEAAAPFSFSFHGASRRRPGSDTSYTPRSMKRLRRSHCESMSASAATPSTEGMNAMLEDRNPFRFGMAPARSDNEGRPATAAAPRPPTDRRAMIDASTAEAERARLVLRTVLSTIDSARSTMGVADGGVRASAVISERDRRRMAMCAARRAGNSAYEMDASGRSDSDVSVQEVRPAVASERQPPRHDASRATYGRSFDSFDHEERDRLFNTGRHAPAQLDRQLRDMEQTITAMRTRLSEADDAREES